MRRQASNISPSAKLIRHKLPLPMKIVLWYGLPIIVVVTLSAIFQTQQFDVAAIIFFLGGGLALVIFTNHSGYRIAWDSEKIYMREWGWKNLLFQRYPWRSLAYTDMRRMRGTSPPNPAPGVSRIMPFQVLEISSANRNEEGVALYASGLNEPDLAELLVYLRSVRPDIFPEKLSKSLRKRGILDGR